MGESRSGAAKSAAEASETPPRNRGEKGRQERLRRRSILEMLDHDPPPEVDADGRSSASREGGRGADGGEESGAGGGTEGSAPDGPQRRSFKNPETVQVRRRTSVEGIVEDDTVAAAGPDAGQPATSIAGSTGSGASGGATGEASSASEGTDEGDTTGAGVAVDDHPARDESAQSVVDELVPEWIGTEETTHERGFLRRLLDRLLGRDEATSEPVARPDPEGMVASGPEAVEVTAPDEASASSGDETAPASDAARAEVRRMIQERDRELVSAKRNSARLYELAVSVEDFVDEVLRTARTL